MKDNRSFVARLKSFIHKELPDCEICKTWSIPRHPDRFRSMIIRLVSGKKPAPWEYFSDDTLLDVIATLKMGCCTHHDEFYRKAGKREIINEGDRDDNKMSSM